MFICVITRKIIRLDISIKNISSCYNLYYIDVTTKRTECRYVKLFNWIHFLRRLIRLNSGANCVGNITMMSNATIELKISSLEKLNYETDKVFLIM